MTSNCIPNYYRWSGNKIADTKVVPEKKRGILRRCLSEDEALKLVHEKSGVLPQLYLAPSHISMY